MARVVYNLADYGGEKSSVGLNLNALANEGTVRSAIDGVTLGVIQKATLVDSEVTISSANAASPFAQVELGLRIHLSDNVNGESGYVTIPCPDLASLTLEGDGVVLADAGIMAALVTQIETNVLSRDDNAVTVTRAEIVGRNR